MLLYVIRFPAKVWHCWKSYFPVKRSVCLISSSWNYSVLRLSKTLRALRKFIDVVFALLEKISRDKTSCKIHFSFQRNKSHMHSQLGYYRVIKQLCKYRMRLNDEINSLCLKLEERNLFILETIVIQIKNMLCFLKIEDLYSRELLTYSNWFPGRQFDKNGELNQWWEESAIERFDTQTRCMVDQYDSCVVPEVNLTVSLMWRDICHRVNIG